MPIGKLKARVHDGGAYVNMEAMAKAIIAHAIPQIPSQPSWPCHEALQNAIMADKKLWPAKAKRELEPILKKYF